eukprot:TRINITY_DN866_c1_g1_i3.p1 TRINITY_DN866_c1_g1~~TRINITY_DN866_c1_g1_i3.p1  ORF type:complete len:270 (+),score=33.83 TRINITY_DN866_c1_g1_i3:96-812(+)
MQTAEDETSRKPPKRVHLKKKGFLSNIGAIRPVSKVVPSCSVNFEEDEEQFASRVLPWLYLGGVKDAEDQMMIRKKGITHVVDLTTESNAVRWQGVTYLSINVEDHSDQLISPHFAKITAFIENARTNNSSTLVHCRMGVSRSATAVIAYLIQTLSIPFVLARDIVRQHRPSINPNMGFVAALTQFEHSCIDDSTPMSVFKDRLAEWSLASPLTDTSDLCDSPASSGSPCTPDGGICY